MLVLGSVWIRSNRKPRSTRENVTLSNDRTALPAFHILLAQVQPSEKSKLRTEAASWKQAFCFRHETLIASFPPNLVNENRESWWFVLKQSSFKRCFPTFSSDKNRGWFLQNLGFLGTQTVGGGETIKCRTCRHRMYTTEAGGLKGSLFRNVEISKMPQRHISRWWQLKYFWIFHPYLGSVSNLTSIFFKGLETTN